MIKWFDDARSTHSALVHRVGEVSLHGISIATATGALCGFG